MKAPARLSDAPVRAVADSGWLQEGLRRMAIVSADSDPLCVPLTGGVSSDIYRVDLSDGRSVCVKRALPKLKVAADWRAPIERNRWEVEWMRVAAGIVPRAVPPILGEDRATGCFAMAWLAPESVPVGRFTFAFWTAAATSSIPTPRDASARGFRRIRTAYFWEPKTSTCATPFTMEIRWAMMVWA